MFRMLEARDHQVDAPGKGVVLAKNRPVLPAAVMAGSAPAATAQRPLSVFDIFRVGIGPSSSHTVGPMRAAWVFAGRLRQLLDAAAAPRLGRVTVELFGSLGATGRGHATDRAVLLGLAGLKPESVTSQQVSDSLPHLAATGTTPIAGRVIAFDMNRDIAFLPRIVLPYHVNGLRLRAFCLDDVPATHPLPAAGCEWDARPACAGPAATPGGPDGKEAGGNVGPQGSKQEGELLLEGVFYSVGGGFVMEQVGGSLDEPQCQALASAQTRELHSIPAPYPFSTGEELLAHAEASGLRMSQLVRANEEAARGREEVDGYIDQVIAVMEECIEAGCNTHGVLPGGLNVPRRAAVLAQQLLSRSPYPTNTWRDAGDPLAGIDWVNLYALAVNEENAAGHRVVTAPTNGAAGVVPAVLEYYLRFVPGASREGARDFLLAATAVGALIKTNASIAGAEVGCQGEVGSAAAMAAAGLADALGGTARQVENAAEIAMEHNLGLTCDPVAGLVQIPCIERNAIAAVKAINAARMALWGDGRHQVSLDTVIETMRQTGQDMLSKYKETSEGGLAVNVVEC
ncbi:MAG: L-serine ammonia-lyase [Buchananella hordeovulneris]|nr:L-serine ammonia-lyase [Buchananella hordeovulneris]